MRTALVLVLALALALAACKSSSDPSPPTPTSSASAERPAAPTAAEPPGPPPYTGPMTLERITASRGIVKDFDAWSTAYPKVVGKLGEAARISKGSFGERYEWAFAEDTTCVSFSLVKAVLVGSTVAKVGQQEDPKKSSMPAALKGDGVDWRPFTECLAILGKKPGLPADDPKVPGPKAVVTIAELQSGVERAPNKWLGKTVTVKGTYEGISMGAELIVGEGNGSKRSLLCHPPEGKKPPAQKGVSEKITVQGKVHDPRVLLGSADTGFKPDLAECTVQ